MLARNAADLGSILRRARTGRGMTQLDVARLIGTSRQWVVSAEQGSPATRVGLMIRALQAVEVSLDAIDTPTGPAVDPMIDALLAGERHA